MSGAKLEGGVVGSQAIQLTPGTVRGTSFVGDTGTAGSCTLLAQVRSHTLSVHVSNGDEVTNYERWKEGEPSNCAHLLFFSQSAISLQVALPVAIYAPEPVTLTLKGGTDAEMAPPVDYLSHVLLPLLQQKLNLQCSLQCPLRGFYPRGGGQVSLQITPLAPNTALPPILLSDFGSISSIHISAFVAGTKFKLQDAERAVAAAKNSLLVELGSACPTDKGAIETKAYEVPQAGAVGHGGGVLIRVRTTTGCILGAAQPLKRGERLDCTAEKAAAALGRDLKAGACVDEYLQDQLIIFAALAEGESRIRCGKMLTMHTQTAMAICAQLTGCRFRTETSEGAEGTTVVVCEGVGWKRKTS